MVALLLCAAAGAAQSIPPVTPNVGLYLPAHGSFNWDSWYNANWAAVDTGLANPINVKSPLYAAKGDGVTDDTLPIQRAITAAGNGSVLLPCGTFLVTGGGLTISAGVGFVGMGTCSVLNYTGTAQAVHVTSVNAINVTISGIRFVGSSAALGGGILDDATNLLLKIDHNYFSGFSGTNASDIQITTNNAEIEANYFAGGGNRGVKLTCGGGGAQYGQAVDVIANTFGGGAGYTTEYILSQCPNNRFLHNTYNGGAPIAIHLNGGNGQIVKDSWFEFLSNTMVKIENASYTDVENNFFDPQSTTLYGVSAAVSSTNNTIKNNLLNSAFATQSYNFPAAGGVLNTFESPGSCPSDISQFGYAYCFANGNRLALHPALGGAQTGNILEYYGGTGGALSNYITPSGVVGLRTGGGYEAIWSVGRTSEDFKIIANNTAAAYMGGTLAGDFILGSANGNNIVMGNLASATTGFLLNTSTKAFTFTGAGTVNGSLNVQGGVLANGVSGVSVSGSSCTVKAISGGIITSATCP